MLSTRPPSLLLQQRGRPQRQARHACPSPAARSGRARQAPSSASAGTTTTIAATPAAPTSAPAALGRPRPRRPRRPAASAAGGRSEPLPQNTDNPLVLPSPSLASPLDAVAVQLDALSSNELDSPWPLHGVAVCYAFCADSGSLELSRYFAPLSTSLYHQDHFQGKFLTRFPGLVGHNGWEVVEEEAEEDGVAAVRVGVSPAAAAAAATPGPEGSSGGGAAGETRHTYVFVMVRQEAGLRKGSWVTAQVVRLGPDGAVV
jgi:hypothetical protein